MKISVYSEYISVACNRVPAIADWNQEGLICFGASNNVVLWNYVSNKQYCSIMEVITLK